MKKALLAAITAVLLCSCGKTTSSNSEDLVSTQSSEIDTEQDTSAYNFPEVENDADKILEFYRQEVSRRREVSLASLSNNSFVTEAEKNWLNSHGYEVSDYEDGIIYKYSSYYHEVSYNYYPVVIFTNNENSLVYTTEDGFVLITPSNYGNVIGGLHLTFDEIHQLGDPTIIEDYVTRTIVHTGTEFQVYEFGNLVQTVPVNGVFCGHSFWEGFLFRDGTDVYVVDDATGTFISTVIAHNVKYVIECNYKLTSDMWSQPLFLMTDGSLKSHSLWENAEEPDSPDNLVEPHYEGGYH